MARKLRVENAGACYHVINRGNYRRDLFTGKRKLPAQRSAPEKLKLAAAMKRVSSVSNGWLAERLQMGPAASVSQYVRRFHLADLGRSSEFQRALSKEQPKDLTS